MRMVFGSATSGCKGFCMVLHTSKPGSMSKSYLVVAVNLGELQKCKRALLVFSVLGLFLIQVGG